MTPLAPGPVLLYKSGVELFLCSSAVEQPAVNRRVVGSNPTGGAEENPSS